VASPKYKPLFNRRYLLILVWVLPVVILLLHQYAAQPSALEHLSWDSRRQHYWMPAENSQSRLELLLPRTATLNDSDWIETSVAQQALQARISEPDVQTLLDQQQWQLSVSSQPAFTLLQLSFTEPPEQEAITRLLNLLGEQPYFDWRGARDRLQAQRYLASQSAQSRLLSTFGEKLPRPDRSIESLYSRLWWTEPRRLLIARGDTKATDRPPHAALPPNRDWNPGELALSTAELRGRSSDQWRLLGQPLNAPTNGTELAHQRLVAELVSLLLPTLFRQQEDYRWLWQPLLGGGYQALIWRGRQLDRTMLGQYLAAELDAGILAKAQDRLLTSLTRIEQSQPEQWLHLVALYRLPLDSHRAFRDTLNRIDLEQARTLITELLPPNDSFYLYYTDRTTP
jgi:hypothetical protein